jgi:hypothetical protein
MKSKQLIDLLIQEIKGMNKFDICCLKELIKQLETEIAYREIEIQQDYEHPQL